MVDYIADHVTLCRDQLQDAAAGTEVWSAAQLEDHILRAVKVFSLHYGRMRETILPLTTDSKEVNIAALSGRWLIDRVECYVDRSPRKWRGFDEWGDYLTLEIGFTPTAVAETLTGTVTFTNGSTAVTGSGTDFDGEVEAGEYIHKALDTNGELYKVKSVTDDTNLVLDRAYEGTTGADTANLTELRTYDEVCRVFWAGMHTLAATTKTYPSPYEQTIVDGACAFALRAYASYARETIDDAINIVDTMDTQIDLVGARITQMVSDVLLGRQDIEKQTAAAETAMTASGTSLTAITTLAEAADDKVAAYTIAPEMTRYSQLMNAYYQQSLGHLQRFQGYISEGGKIISEDLNVALGELKAIEGIIAHGKGYAEECIALLRSGDAVLKHAIQEADRREAIFNDACKIAAARFREKLSTPCRYPTGV